MTWVQASAARSGAPPSRCRRRSMAARRAVSPMPMRGCWTGSMRGCCNACTTSVKVAAVRRCSRSRRSSLHWARTHGSSSSPPSPGMPMHQHPCCGGCTSLRVPRKAPRSTACSLRWRAASDWMQHAHPRLRRRRGPSSSSGCCTTWCCPSMDWLDSSHRPSAVAGAGTGPPRLPCWCCAREGWRRWPPATRATAITCCRRSRRCSSARRLLIPVPRPTCVAICNGPCSGARRVPLWWRPQHPRSRCRGACAGGCTRVTTCSARCARPTCANSTRCCCPASPRSCAKAWATARLIRSACTTT